MMRRKTVPVADDPSAFRQRVRIAAVQVAGLRPDELAAALAYEVEPFSGIPAAEAELHCEPVPDSDPAVRVFEVAVRRRAVRGAGPAGRLTTVVAALGAVAVLAACADFAVLSSRLKALNGEFAVRSGLQSRLDAVRGSAARVRAESRELRDRRAAAEKAQSDAARARAAYADALEAVATACGDRAVLSSIGGEAFAMRISGVAASADAAAETLADLTEKAAAGGWRLVPGTIAVRTPGLTAEFTCEMTHD